MEGKTAVLLLNVGTPDAPEVKAVRRYLTEFLNDPRVIGGPWLFRKILVNLIIVPFRAPKSTRLYQKLWTEAGSPLLVNGKRLEAKVQQRLGDRYLVRLAMNYGQPAVKEVLKEVIAAGVDRIIAFPLYPQYASSTTGSSVARVMRVLSEELHMPAFSSVLQYFDDPRYLSAMKDRLSACDMAAYDHVLFSFHGLPLSQVEAAHGGKSCDSFHCTSESNEQNRFCYQAACYATTRNLIRTMGMEEGRTTVCFQSRLTRNWLQPFTDQTLRELAGRGCKKVLVICPSFTADCLETTVEIGDEYRSLFLSLGGTTLDLAESLNDSDAWVEAVAQMVG
jgi:protoporphyrin/coproporphyrin ferrochelatase